MGDFQISKYYIGDDPLLNYTGDNGFRGSINFNDSSFGFNSGYLTEYSLSCSIGKIPESRASIKVFGDIGSGISSSGDAAHPPIQIPNQGSIKLITTGYQNNRVTNFSYTLRIDRKPIYKIGSPHPVQVDRAFPLLQEASFDMDVNDHEVLRIHEYLIKPQQQEVRITLNNPIDNTLIQSISMPKARLLSNTVKSSSDGMMTLSLSYKGYINKK